MATFSHASSLLVLKWYPGYFGSHSTLNFLTTLIRWGEEKSLFGGLATLGGVLRMLKNMDDKNNQDQNVSLVQTATITGRGKITGTVHPGFPFNYLRLPPLTESRKANETNNPGLCLGVTAIWHPKTQLGTSNHPYITHHCDDRWSSHKEIRTSRP